ncbi:MAG: signal peptidase II [Hyphomicrobiales bacterium]
MIKEYLKSFSIFFGGWTLAMIVFLVFGSFGDVFVFILDWIIPAVILGCLGIILASFYRKVNVKSNNIRWLVILLLIIIDQGSKIKLFSMDYMTMNIPLIEPSFYLRPIQNTHGSYFASLLNLDVPKFLYFILYIIISFLFFKAYRFYVKKKQNSIWLKSFITLFISGVLCVAIDNGYWGGSLDFIFINPLYIFDIKDIYLTSAILCLVVELYNNKLLFNSNISKEREKELRKEFIRFIFNEKKTHSDKK